MFCRHFGSCGGCQTQDVPYAEQLVRKQQVLQARLTTLFGTAAPVVEPVIGMPVSDDGRPWHFRHKAAFVFGGTPRELTIGHYAAGSRRVIAIEECPVHSGRANQLAFALREQLARAGVRAYGHAPGGVLRHVVVRTTRDEREAIVVLVVARNDPRLRRPVRAFLAREPVTGLLVNINDSPNPYLIGPATIRVHGSDRVRETVGGASFLTSPAAFFQTNPDAADVLVRLVREEAGGPHGSGRSLDLYAGSGLFAVTLALDGWRVTAVEDNGDAVRDGDANVRLNRVPDRVRFVRARVEDAAGRARRAVPAVVVLDPPRSGCPPAVVRAVFGELGAPRVLYVSCNPEAFLAEAPSIVSAGYGITAIRPVDMFPHTLHVELVARLDKR